MERRDFLKALLSGTTSVGVSAAAPLVLANPDVIVVPIVGGAAPIKDIQLGTLRRIYLGYPTEMTGDRRYIPFNHTPRTPTRTLFDRRVLDMDPDEVARYWIDQRIRGNRRAPRKLPSALLAKKVVNHLSGAIAYVAKEDLDDSVIALKVDGKHYTDSDYIIKE